MQRTRALLQPSASSLPESAWRRIRSVVGCSARAGAWGRALRDPQLRPQSCGSLGHELVNQGEMSLHYWNTSTRTT